VEPVISPRLEEGRDMILAISDKIGRVQDYHKVAASEVQTVLKFGLVEVVYEWAKGLVRPTDGVSCVQLNFFFSSKAFRADHASDRRSRGHDRPSNNTPGRDL
jgi:superfamily II RNA helicase